VSKILIVEDDSTGAQLLATLLKMEGHQTVQAEHWTNLLQDIEQQRPDLVIMDVRLRTQSGFDVLRQVRAHPDSAIAHTPVLMMSAEDHRVQSRRAGANGFIDKPYNLAALANAIRHAEEGEQ
jgi:DNA-binding response OmpR family regulator